MQTPCNRSPNLPAAPHGAYRCQGKDRWIAISVFNDEEWLALLKVLGNPAWAKDAKFAKFAARLLNQDELDKLVESETVKHEPFDLMNRLQEAGVAAGVCQTAADRIYTDPQLKHRGFQKMLPHSEVGEWPYKDFPVHLSESPAYVGGAINRGFPCYGEDNPYVYGTLLGIGGGEQKRLAGENII